MKQRKLVIAAIAIAVGSVFGSVVPAGASSSHTVQIKDIDFHPRTITVRHGDTVRWVWLDGTTPHNVKSVGSTRFQSSPTKTRGTYTVRFSHPGTYRYVCTIHFNMKGKVVVR